MFNNSLYCIYLVWFKWLHSMCTWQILRCDSYIDMKWWLLLRVMTPRHTQHGGNSDLFTIVHGGVSFMHWLLNHTLWVDPLTSSMLRGWMRPQTCLYIVTKGLSSSCKLNNSHPTCKQSLKTIQYVFWTTKCT